MPRQEEGRAALCTAPYGGAIPTDWGEDAFVQLKLAKFQHKNNLSEWFECKKISAKQNSTPL